MSDDVTVNNLDLSVVGKTAPAIPSKYDIIPIHTSDRGTFKFCRRQWAWSSPSRFNLIPKASVHGVRENLWFGTGIHYALEQYYNPAIKADPVVEWEKWFELQWSGGLVAASQIDEFVDREPELQSNGLYRISGLNNLLPNPDEEKFLGYRELGIGMMKYYKEYAEAHDNFSVIATEHSFSVPILDPRTGKPLYMVDKRAMPDDWEPNYTLENEYGPLMRHVEWWNHELNQKEWGVEKQVHARGKMDVIVQDNDSGRYGIRDYKTSSYEVTDDSDYFRHLELDEQCTTYLWAAQIEAKLYGLEYESVDYIDYVALLKKFPKPPTPLQSGLPSVNRKEESTTAAMFEAYIMNHGLKAIFDVDAKMQSYYTWLLETEKNGGRFINVKQTWRNPMQRKNMGIRIYYEALDMLNNPRLYPNPTKNYSCLNCIFRAPCIAAEDGSDWESMIEDGYIPNWDR